MSGRAQKNPLFGAAVLKVTYLAREGRAEAAGLKEIYEGVLADLGLSDGEVEAYLAEHGEEIRAALAKAGDR